MNMKKYYFVSAIAALALASCANDDFLGEVPGNNPSAVNGKEISFSGEAGKTTRADGDKTGEKAAGLLKNNFIVFGCKTINNASQTVYDHYNVNWIDNSKKWEYIGQTKNKLNTTATNQSIKYWDYSATDYKFVAFSLGEATQGTDVTITRVDNNATSYTLTGTAANLAKCFVADRITAKPTNAISENNEVLYGQSVSFKFHSLGTKVNIGLYETIPGYSINSVKFYESNETGATSSETPTLFASSATIQTDDNTKQKSAKVTFGNDNKVNVSWEEEEVTKAAITKSTKITFGSLPKVEQDGNETAGDYYLSRENNKANCIVESANAVIPGNETGALTLKIDYTLIATDGSGETIEVKGANATIPAEQTKWESNKIYTYIFNISANTNGSTGGSSTGLKPITFEAIVTDIAGNQHETEIKDSTTNGQQ